MSAIKNLCWKILFSMFLLLVFFSCKDKHSQTPIPKNPDEITFVSISNIGGDEGYYRIIKATKDSVSFEQGITATKKHRYWKAPIQPKVWKGLISAIDIKTLNSIKSSPSAQSVDGIDETFQIRTRKKAHVYVNSYHDTLHYKQLQNLKKRLEEILPEDYQ